jgi:hypothetical protein
MLPNTPFKQDAVHLTTQPTAPWLVGNTSDTSVKRVMQTSNHGFEISDAA